ncbi:MAG: signal peptidase I [Bacteroidota bacterium]
MKPELLDIESESSPGVRSFQVRSLVEYAKTVLATLLVAILIKVFVVEAFRIPSGSMENTLQVGDFLLVNKLAYGIRTPRMIPLTTISLPVSAFSFSSSVRRGDVIVFEFPGIQRDAEGGMNDVNYIKRCIGLPGDTVAIRQSRVFVNGREMLFSRNVKVNGSDGYAAWQRGIRLNPPGRGYTENEYGPVVVPRRGDVISLKRATFDEWEEFIEREGRTPRIAADGTVTIDGAVSASYTVERDYYFMLGDNRSNSLDSRFWGFVPRENLVGEALLVYWSWDSDLSFLSLWDKLGSIRWERIGTLVR